MTQCLSFLCGYLYRLPVGPAPGWIIPRVLFYHRPDTAHATKTQLFVCSWLWQSELLCCLPSSLLSVHCACWELKIFHYIPAHSTMPFFSSFSQPSWFCRCPVICSVYTLQFFFTLFSFLLMNSSQFFIKRGYFSFLVPTMYKLCDQILFTHFSVQHDSVRAWQNHVFKAFQPPLNAHHGDQWASHNATHTVHRCGSIVPQCSRN